MSQDFVFINPQNIPPRRAVPHKKRSGRKRVRSGYIPELESQENYLSQPGPDFNFTNEFSGQIILSSNNSLPAEAEEYFSKENETDPLTQAIFGLGSKLKNRATDIQYSLETPAASPGLVPAVPLLKTKAEERAELVAELEKIDEADSRLFRKIGRLVAPGRISPIKIKSQTPKISLTEIQEAIRPVELDDDSNYIEAEATQPPVQDLARAEVDWFQVSLMDQEPNRNLPKLRQNRIKPEESDEADNSNKDPHRLKTFLAGLAIVLVPVTLSFLAFSGGPNFIKTAVASFNDRFLGATSFTLINSGESSIFSEVSQARKSLAGTGDNTQITARLDDFLEKNSAFGWLNIFKKKVLGANVVTISGTDLLSQAVQAIADSPANKLAKEKLKEQTSLFAFWNQIFTPEKKYLVVMVDADAPRPIGGKPMSYAVVKVNADGLDIIASGKFGDLDAAADAKIIPPQAIQAIGTAWLPSEAGWFLNFSDSASTLVDFFERTTQTKTDGLVAVSKDFLKAISFRESLIFDVDSSSWLYGLNEALAHKPDGRWSNLASFLNSGLANHQVQFYFKDSLLEQKVAAENWSAGLKNSPNEDVLGLAWSSLKGAGSSLDLVEHKATIFEDGSIVVNLSLTLRQDVGESSNYFKVYLPKGAQVLSGDGFSNRAAVPKFDYTANGFNASGRLSPVVITTASTLKNTDTFEESGLTAVGGWVELKSGDRKKINLQYILPFRLAYKNSRSSYNFKILRPEQTNDTPFRFSLTSDKSTSIISLDPNGFISQNTGEYQGNLTQDLTLQADLVFNSE